MDISELKDFLDEKVLLYNKPDFIETDPIQIPHLFTLKEDIEIAGFLIATIAWGNRKSIITNGKKLVNIMGNSPHDFIMNYSDDNYDDSGLENIFSQHAEKDSLQPAIHEFKKVFFELPHQGRITKHVSDPLKNSAAKRINMFLRWMVRKDNAGVDFGIWNSISSSQLSCPLDVHSGNVARKLDLLQRKQNDAKAVKELDISLRSIDALDPAKYDFALFGLGAFENF